MTVMCCCYGCRPLAVAMSASFPRLTWTKRAGIVILPHRPEKNGAETGTVVAGM